MNKVKTFLIVCYANYCRSPVAEHLLRQKYNDVANFISAGIDPFPAANMDRRSSDYLINQGIKAPDHNPKKLSMELAKNADYILAMDNIILLYLNNLFPSHKQKFLLFNKGLPLLNVFDPFKVDDNKYQESMKRIKTICEDFEKNFQINL